MTDETQADPSAPTTASRGALAAGTQLGRYTLERILGSGGMGVVWAARDPDLERSVAIKVLRAGDSGPELRTRLLREARAMARLKHPNVLTVYEVGTAGERDYIVMELVDGENLDAWLAGGPPQPDVWQAVIAAGRGLAAAHAAGLVHRDFKPHNVLRSRDGRVLVTDFGLARGTAEEPAAPPRAVELPSAVALADTLAGAASASSRPRDGVLDSTLTRTGALIGTPAYMAPEQYEGAPPDPRTDQFAFCVTAWQALAGDRPFRGQTIDELRRAAGAGVAGVPARLPRRVRAVLARGLAVDPDARWPDLATLLGQLERAARLPRQRRQLAVTGFALVASALLAFRLWHHDNAPPPAPAPSPYGCMAPERAFADAWSPAQRAALEHRLGGATAASAVAAALDETRDRWMKAYAGACAAPPGPSPMAKVACLLGERDELVGFARLLATIPADRIDELDLGGILPRVEACESDSPVMPPLLPEDSRQRDQVIALRARLFELRMQPPDQLGTQIIGLLDSAKRLHWAPGTAEVLAASASALESWGEYERARQGFEVAAGLAEQLHDYGLEAAARVGSYEVDAIASGAPSDPGRAQQLESAATRAIHLAGDDPVLLRAVDVVHATIDANAGNRDQAIATLEKARGELLHLRGTREAAAAAASEVHALLERGRPGDLDTAWHVVTDTEQALAAAHFRLHGGPLEAAGIEVAWRRGELIEAHDRADRVRHPIEPADEIAISGRVVGPDGAPAGGARVVAWHGGLVGDATRMYTRGDFEGQVVTTGPDGRFEVHAPIGGAILAEHGALRSRAIAAGARAREDVQLALDATRTITGRVHAAGRIPYDLAAQIAVPVAGETRWILAAPVAADGSFRLAGAPADGGVLQLDAGGHVVRYGAPADARELTWRGSTTVDVIARGPAGSRAVVYVFRGHLQPRTRDNLVALATSAADVVAIAASPVGLASEVVLPGAQAFAGYERGDLHAVARDDQAGPITVCAAWLKPPGAIRCEHEDLPRIGHDQRSDSRFVIQAPPQ